MSAALRSGKWIAFVGPSLPAREVKAFGCQLRPPARQGDVWRALLEQPRALVLIDGVFESQPSVWHHELRAALASGVAVFGASSMGALRAAELAGEGMIGVGEIFRSFRDRKRIDDADVALLHADAEHGFRALTLPIVNLEHAARLARREKILTPSEARRLLRSGAAIHYQQRQWPAVLDGAALSSPRRAKLQQWLQTTDVDLKAADARECLTVAADWMRARAPGPAPRACAQSSFVRRRRLLDASPGALAKAQRLSNAEALADAGTRRRLLAGWARAMGVIPEEGAVRRWLATIPVRGLAADERVRLAEDAALEQTLLQAPERWLADGPSRVEGLADELMRQGRWKK